MRSYTDELEAMREVMNRAEVYKAPDADEEMTKRHGPHAATATAGLKPWAGEAMLAICMLFRGKPLLPDNRIGKCADCREAIQWRPNISRKLKPKLCAFCALRRARGDA